jgi:hypothetical protein
MALNKFTNLKTAQESVVTQRNVPCEGSRRSRLPATPWTLRRTGSRLHACGGLVGKHENDRLVWHSPNEFSAAEELRLKEKRCIKKMQKRNALCEEITSRAVACADP